MYKGFTWQIFGDYRSNSTERSSYNVLDKFIIIKLLKIYFEHENWSLKFDLSGM